jgi:hypothetical protein
VFVNQVSKNPVRLGGKGHRQNVPRGRHTSGCLGFKSFGSYRPLIQQSSPNRLASELRGGR